MARLFKWLLRLFLLLVMLVLGAGALVWWLAARSLPDYDRTDRLTGLEGRVEIVRNAQAIPHIFATSDRDAFFALGYVHAQDRLWQMTMLRRTAQGRLSEIFGTRTVAIDSFIRRLDLYRLAEESLRFQDEPTKQALQAYADGVNAWLKIVQDEALGRGAPEFFLFTKLIAPWRPADSLAILRLMAWQLTGQMKAEILRARVSLQLPPERVQDILPDAPGPGAAALPRYGSLFPDLPLPSRQAARAPRPRDPLDPTPEWDMAGASNAFAAAPGRTTGKGALLANDPHLGLTAPSIWYLARLSLSSGDVIGGTIPGMPAVLVGRSERLGWGLTTAYLDDQDLFVEKVNPADPTQYLTPTGWRPFRTRQEVIRVRDAEPVTITLRWTENGPVIPGSQFDLAAITPEGHVMALGWTALTVADRSMSGALALMRAQSVDEGIAAGRLVTAPAQMLTLADRDGIALQMIGRMPARDPAHQTKGRMPAPGWQAENRWRGFLPYEDNPRFVNPPGGIVANTNNKIEDRPFPLHVSYSWGDTQRIERLQKLLGSRKVHTRDSFIEAQLDTVSFPARALLPLIARDMWLRPEPPDPADARAVMRQKALDMLAKWNGEMSEHLPEPLIFVAWMRQLQQALIADELGGLAARFGRFDPIFLERVYRNVGGAAAWCDVGPSTARETCLDMARQSLDAALAELTDRFGPDMDAWRWGDAHVAMQDHEVLGKLPLLSWFVNIRQSTSGGDNTLMRGRTAGSGPNPYANVHASGYRGVYDFADPESSVFIISTGQSGHFLSRFYDDLAQKWRRGEYVPMTLDPALARAAAVGVTVLLPAKDGDGQ